MLQLQLGEPLFLIYVLVFGLAGVACLLSVTVAWTIEDTGIKVGLVGLFLSSGLWAISSVGYLVVPGPMNKSIIYVIGIIIGFATVGGWLYFASAYTGRDYHRNPIIRWLAVGIFAIITLVKVTNPIHNRYFETVMVDVPFTHLAIYQHTFHWVAMGIAYSLAAIGLFMLVEFFIETGRRSTPIAVLASLTGLPVVFNVASTMDPRILEFAYEPIGVAIFAVGILFVYDKRFHALKLSGNVSKPTIVLDQDGNVIDYGGRAREICPQPALDIPIETAWPGIEETLAAEESVITIDTGEGDRHYHVSQHDESLTRPGIGSIITLSDVTERIKYEQKLKRQRDALEILNQVVRHDIRNDLQLIVAYAEMLDDHVDRGEPAAYLDTIEESTKNAISLTNTARDIADVLMKSHVESTPIQLAPVLESELATISLAADDADIFVVGSLPDVEVTADQLLGSVIRNLVKNAIQHNDTETPAITVSVDTDPESVLLRVADNGPGIPEDRRDEIFGKGEKGLESEGTGIGLYLVQTLVDGYGGEVWIEDNEPRGSVFNVSLPRAEWSDPETS